MSSRVTCFLSVARVESESPKIVTLFKSLTLVTLSLVLEFDRNRILKFEKTVNRIQIFSNRVWSLKCDSDELCLLLELVALLKRWATEVARVTFSDSDTAPVFKFWNPGPDPAIFLIWESDSCLDCGYNHQSNLNLPMFYIRNDNTDSC